MQGSIFGWGTKIPHAAEQLSLPTIIREVHATTTSPPSQKKKKNPPHIFLKQSHAP